MWLTASSEWGQVFVMFDVGPHKHQVSVHEVFLTINEVAKSVFRKIFQYSELLTISPDEHRKAYRIPESLDTFKLFLVFLARDTAQRPGLPPLWVLDEKRAEDLLDFARKWDMDDLQEELREFIKPFYERRYGFG